MIVCVCATAESVDLNSSEEDIDGESVRTEAAKEMVEQLNSESPNRNQGQTSQVEGEEGEESKLATFV